MLPKGYETCKAAQGLVVLIPEEAASRLDHEVYG